MALHVASCKFERLGGGGTRLAGPVLSMERCSPGGRGPANHSPTQTGRHAQGLHGCETSKPRSCTSNERTSHNESNHARAWLLAFACDRDAVRSPAQPSRTRFRGDAGASLREGRVQQVCLASQPISGARLRVARRSISDSAYPSVDVIACTGRGSRIGDHFFSPDRVAGAAWPAGFEQRQDEQSWSWAWPGSFVKPSSNAMLGV